MRAKILKTIDENLLDKAIDEWSMRYSYEVNGNSFIIMSSETARELATSVGIKYMADVSHGGMYKGNKIAICESIPFGEVEIR